jgi:hypothetical protein
MPPQITEYQGGKSRLVYALELRAALGLGTTPEEYWILRNSEMAHTLEIMFDEVDRAIGYMAWARVSRATIERLQRNAQLPKYFYEWEEGGICLILDVLLLPRYKYDAIRQLRLFIRRRRAIVPARKGRPLRLYLRKGRRFRRQYLSSGKRVVPANRGSLHPQEPGLAGSRC